MRSRTLAVGGILAGVLVLTGCGGNEATIGAQSADPTSEASSDASADFNDADVSFVSGMVPHHEQAVEMADIVLADEPSPEVADVAEQIKAAQQPEIEQLNQMLAHFGVDAESAGGHDGGHGGGHGGGDAPMHGGMMTEQELAAFEAASGTDAERRFLTLMIAHHEGAIDAVETELAEGEYAPARELAESIRDSQAAEIEQMEQLLAQL
jgi:uncharacterized protein (DUF305 family)